MSRSGCGPHAVPVVLPEEPLTNSGRGERGNSVHGGDGDGSEMISVQC